MVIYFFKNPSGSFHFFTLCLEIPDKTAQIFHKIVLDPLQLGYGNSKAKNNGTPWKFHIIFFGHPWKSSHFVFNGNPRKFHMLYFLMPLDIRYPQPPSCLPPVWIFPGIVSNLYSEHDES